MSKRDESIAEHAAVSRLLRAYARSLAKDLNEASEGPRAFLLITAPLDRGGKMMVVSNSSGGDFAEFVAAALTALETHPEDAEEFYVRD